MKEKTTRFCVLIALCAAVLAPYHRLILGKKIPIPSDVFISDLADGEFPIRVEAGHLIRAGELPFWTPDIMTGTPFFTDPLSMALFALFPPALALGLLYGILLLLTATGTYLLARHLGASRAGAFLSGFSFAWSGFFVCQMRHLGIIGTVAFFPYALYCLERAFAQQGKDDSQAQRLPASHTLLWLMLFGLCFGMQILAGFPQTAYICSLVYGLLIAWRLGWLFRRQAFKSFIRPASTLILGVGFAGLLGALMGMCQLLPLWELGTVSDRASGVSFEAATALPYPLACIITFFCPYYHGDISTFSFAFMKNALFWEVYGYAGMFTFVLAGLASGNALFRLLRRKKFRTAQQPGQQGIAIGPLLFWTSLCIFSFCMVLGPQTPLYRLAFDFLPGLSAFRFPTRFLFVTVLSLSILGGLGLTWLQNALCRLLPQQAATRNRLFIGCLFAGMTVVDLVYHNLRQNPMVESRQWLAPPETARIIRQQPTPGRIYSPYASNHHRRTFYTAKGWAGDLTPYDLQRNLLQPNANLLHRIPSLNAYSGISPRWVVDLIGDHNRYGLLLELRREKNTQPYYQWLQALSVQWMIFPTPEETPYLTYNGQTSPVSHLYEVKAPLPRARFARQLLCLESMERVKQMTLDGTLDPRLTTLLHSAQDLELVRTTLASWAKSSPPTGHPYRPATIRVDRATQVTIETQTPQGGFLVLADTYYPGWKATIDGEETPIMRANVMHRGVLVPPGKRTITFCYQPWTVHWGIALSLLAFLSLVSLICYFYYKTKEKTV